MEDDSFTSFGSLTYARSFLKTYATMLNVDASDVLDHIQPPPLGGVRDYRYLVEDFGPWVGDHNDHQAMASSQASVRATRSLGMVVAVCSFILLAGVSILLANSHWFKTSAANPTVDGAGSVMKEGNDKKPIVPDTSTALKAIPVKEGPPPRAEIVR